MKIRVTVTVEAEVTAAVMDPAVIPAISEILEENTYRDGRQDYCVEQIEDGLKRHIEAAVDRAVNLTLYRKYGNRTITQGRYQRGVAGLIAEKRLVGLRVWLMGLGFSAAPVKEEECSGV
jgi:hypothetical protein